MNIAAYPKYESYRDSGVEWWQSIPSHWTVKALKYGLQIKNGQDHKNVLADEGYPVYGSGGQFAYAKEYLHDGEAILLGRKGTIDRPIHVTGKFWSVDTMFYAVCNSNLLPRYAYYYCTTIPFSYFSTSTALPSMTQDDLNNNPVAFPPLPEQRAIATFLDEKCAKIDEAVRIKEEQIKLLRERRQILIQQAVTRGLNPDAPMKDSGIDWIGQIPAHWEVWKVAHAFQRIGSGTTPATGQTAFYDGEIAWLQTGDLTDGAITSTSKNISPLALQKYSTLKIYPPGSLVMAMYGATIGKLGKLEIPSTTNQACCVFSESSIFSTDFAFYSLLAMRPYILSEAYGGGQPNISQQTIKAFRLPAPPSAEQHSIVLFLDEECAAIDGAIKIKLTQITALKEYKTSLINAAVTGKIKVV